MNRNQGIHEVYLEEKEAELMEYAEYKSLIENSANKVPGFFKATALPWKSGPFLAQKLQPCF